MTFIILLSISIFIGHKCRMSEISHNSASIGNSAWETFIIFFVSSLFSFAITILIAISSDFYVVDRNTYKIDKIHTVFVGQETRTRICYEDEKYISLGECLIESGDNEIYVEEKSNDYYWYFPYNIFMKRKYVAYLDIDNVSIEIDDE